MSRNEAPPPYTASDGTNTYDPSQAPKSTFRSDEKSGINLDEKHSLEAQQYPSRTLQPGSSYPRPSSAPGSTWDSQSISDRTGAFSDQGSNVEPAVVFHVCTTKVCWKKEIDVTINGKTDVAFHVTFPRTLFSSKPDVTVQRASAAGPIIANGRLACMSLHKVGSVEFPEAQMHIDIARKSMWSRTCNVTLEGRALEWKGTRHNGASKWSCASLKLVDESGRIYAVFLAKDYKCGRDQGRISIEVPGLSDSMIEQIVCTCLVMMEAEERQRNAASAGAAAGAAS